MPFTDRTQRIIWSAIAILALSAAFGMGYILGRDSGAEAPIIIETD